MRRRKERFFYATVIIACILTLVLTKTVTAGQWVDKNDRTDNVYQGTAGDNEVDTDGLLQKLEQEIGILEKYFSDWLADMAYTLIYNQSEEKNGVDFSIDAVVLGRLGENIDVSYMQFELAEGNPWGLIGSAVYYIVASGCISFAIIYFLYLLAQHFWKSGQRERSELKEVLSDFVLKFLLIFCAYKIVDYGYYFRDVMTYSLLNGVSSMFHVNISDNASIVDTFLMGYINGGMGVVNALFLIASVCAGYFFMFNYIGTALIQTIAFGALPYAIFGSIKNKKLLSAWMATFLSNLIIPMIDAVMLIMPNLINVIAENNVDGLGDSFGIAVIKLAVIWGVIPARNALIQTLCGNVQPASGMRGLAGMALMAARTLGIKKSTGSISAREHLGEHYSETKERQEVEEAADLRFNAVNNDAKVRMNEDIREILDSEEATVRHQSVDDEIERILNDKDESSDEKGNLKEQSDISVSESEGMEITDSDTSKEREEIVDSITQTKDTSEMNVVPVETADGKDSIQEETRSVAESLKTEQKNKSKENFVHREGIKKRNFKITEAKDGLNEHKSSENKIYKKSKQNNADEMREVIFEESARVNKSAEERVHTEIPDKKEKKRVNHKVSDSEEYVVKTEAAGSYLDSKEDAAEKMLEGPDKDRYQNLVMREELQEKAAANKERIGILNHKITNADKKIGAYRNANEEQRGIINDAKQELSDAEKVYTSALNEYHAYRKEYGNASANKQQLETLKKNADTSKEYLDSVRSRVSEEIQNAKDNIDQNDYAIEKVSDYASDIQEEMKQLTEYGQRLDKGIENASQREFQYAANYKAAGMDSQIYSSSEAFRADMVYREKISSLANFKNFDNDNFRKQLTPEQRAKFYSERAMQQIEKRNERYVDNIMGIGAATIAATATAFGGPEMMGGAAMMTYGTGSSVRTLAEDVRANRLEKNLMRNDSNYIKTEDKRVSPESERMDPVIKQGMSDLKSKADVTVKKREDISNRKKILKEHQHNIMLAEELYENSKKK